MARRRVSLAALTLVEFSPPEQVRAASEAGFDAVGLRLIPASDQEPRFPTNGRTRMMRETRQRLNDTGLMVLDVEIVRLQPRTCVEVDYESFLETAAYLGARHVLVAANDPDRSRLVENLSRLAQLAAIYGLTPNLEFMPWTCVTDLKDAVSTLRELDEENIGLLIDVLHFERSSSTISDLERVPSTWLHYVQICDAMAEHPSTVEGMISQARNDRLYPGEGELNLGAILRQMPPGADVSIEAPRLADRGRPAGTRAREAFASVQAFLRANIQ